MIAQHDQASPFPNSPLDWIKWARDVAEPLDLAPSEAHLLLVVATYADAKGDVCPSVKTLKRRCRLSESQTYALLAQLRNRGLMTKARRENRGEGTRTWRRLMASNLAERTSEDLRLAGGNGSGPPDAISHDLQSAGGGPLRPGGGETSGGPETEEPGKRATREEEQQLPRARHVDEVLKIFGSVPSGFDVNGEAINTVLLAHPHVVPMQSALTTVALIQAGEVRTKSVSRLFKGVLQRDEEQASLF